MGSNDEYRFEDMTASGTGAPAPGTPDLSGTRESSATRERLTDVFGQLMDPDNRKQLWMVIGGLLLTFVVYKGIRFVAFELGQHKSTDSPAVIDLANDATTATNYRRLIGLQGQINQIGQGLSTQQDSMAQVQTSLTTLQAQIVANTDALQAMATQVASLQYELKKEEASRAKPLVKKNTDTAVPTQVKYFVKAAVPGRAWLVSEKGSFTTVRIGDVLPGYGMVISINATDGAVATSSGVTLGFNPDDR